MLEGWSGCKTKTHRKRTLWACGLELRLGVNMGQNTHKPLYNVLWQTSTWIVVITRSLQTLITEFVHKEPRVPLPVGGFLANSFLGKDGSWALHNHSTNSSYSQDELEADGSVRIKRKQHGVTAGQCGWRCLVLLRLKCLFALVWSKVHGGLSFGGLALLLS